jgi:hypothetical protein
VTLPPHLIADLGVGRDPNVGETDEPGLLLNITRRLIRAAGGDLVETDTLRLPVR